MSRRKIQKLSLKSETVRTLSGHELDAVGGNIADKITRPQSGFHCPSQLPIGCTDKSQGIGLCRPQQSQGAIGCMESVMICHAGQK